MDTSGKLPPTLQMKDRRSRLNTEGKRLYDRDFLLQLQYASESTTKPIGLPDLREIILGKNNIDVQDEDKDDQRMVRQLHSEDENDMTSCCNSQQNTCTEFTPEKSKIQNHGQLFRSEADGKIKSDLERCKIHPSHEYIMHCNACRVLVCVLCVNTVHKTHDISDIGEVMAVVHRNIQTYQEQLEKQLSLIEHSQKKDDMEFVEWCSTLKTEVNKKRKEVKKTVGIVCDELLDSTIQRYKDDLKDNKELVYEKVLHLKLLLRRVHDVCTQSNSAKISFNQKKKNISHGLPVNTCRVLPVLQLAKTDMKEVAGLIDEFHERTAPKHQEDLMDERKETCDDVCPMERGTYDRSFLLKLRYSKLSTTKPSDLPDMPEIILQETNTYDIIPKSRDTDADSFTYTPRYVISSSEEQKQIKMKRQIKIYSPQIGERQQTEKDDIAS